MCFRCKMIAYYDERKYDCRIPDGKALQAQNATAESSRDMTLRTASFGEMHYLFNETNARWTEALFTAPAGDALVTSHRGRGAAAFFRSNGIPLVLKQYRRGGMVGRLIARRYLFTGLENTRVWREFRLLYQLAQMGLPVPQVVAAEVQRKNRVFYQGQLITVEITNAKTLAEWIERAPLTETVWESIGSTIRRFHDQAVYHDDLNANNIMLDSADRIWLIDFDKGSVGSRRGDQWKLGNLKRLRRSLIKISASIADLQFTESNWCSLMKGYGAPPV